MEIKRITSYKIVDDNKEQYILNKIKDISDENADRLINLFFSTFKISRYPKSEEREELSHELRRPIKLDVKKSLGESEKTRERRDIDDLPTRFNTNDYKIRLEKLGYKADRNTASNDLKVLIDTGKIKKLGRSPEGKGRVMNYEKIFKDEELKNGRVDMTNDIKVREGTIRERTPF